MQKSIPRIRKETVADGRFRRGRDLSGAYFTLEVLGRRFLCQYSGLFYASILPSSIQLGNVSLKSSHTAVAASFTSLVNPRAFKEYLAVSSQRWILVGSGGSSSFNSVSIL